MMTPTHAADVLRRIELDAAQAVVDWRFDDDKRYRLRMGNIVMLAHRALGDCAPPDDDPIISRAMQIHTRDMVDSDHDTERANEGCY